MIHLYASDHFIYSDFFLQLHALVEYETVEAAEKAVSFWLF